MYASYMSNGWKMVQAKAACKSQQFIFFVSGEPKK